MKKEKKELFSMIFLFSILLILTIFLIWVIISNWPAYQLFLIFIGWSILSMILIFKEILELRKKRKMEKWIEFDKFVIKTQLDYHLKTFDSIRNFFLTPNKETEDYKFHIMCFHRFLGDYLDKLQEYFKILDGEFMLKINYTDAVGFSWDGYKQNDRKYINEELKCPKCEGKDFHIGYDPVFNPSEIAVCEFCNTSVPMKDKMNEKCNHEWKTRKNLDSKFCMKCHGSKPKTHEEIFNEKYPIGTQVIIKKDCRIWDRASGKLGTIIEYRLIEGCDFGTPIIKYGRFRKIKGMECWWTKWNYKPFGMLVD